MPQLELSRSRRRTEVLILIALLEESYPTELARLLDAPLYSEQTIVDDLDRQGVLATRKIENNRRVSLEPRYFAHKELRAFLLRFGRGSTRPPIEGDSKTYEAEARGQAPPCP